MIQSHLMGDIEDHFELAVNDFNETKSQNCVGLVKAFLRNIRGVRSDIYIQSAHRLGKPVAGSQRAMTAKIPQSDQRKLIFQNANRQKVTRHYISQQLPASRSERRQFALPEYKTLKGDVRNKAVLAQDKPFVKPSSRHNI